MPEQAYGHHIKEPIVHPRVWWIMETFKGITLHGDSHPACMVGHLHGESPSMNDYDHSCMATVTLHAVSYTHLTLPTSVYV